MSDIKLLTDEELRRMQLVQLELLVELDRVCRKHDINYVIVGGTMLGAIRHKGFIPWDDDADIAMLREDYDKFKKHIGDLDPDICFFQDNDTDPDYLWNYGKLRRTGTTYVRVGQEHLKCKTGIFIDVFPMDDIPISTLGQMLQDFHCFCLRKILWSEVGKYSTKGFMKAWYSLLSHIPKSLVFKSLKRYAAKSSNSTPNKVRTLTFPASGKLYYKSEKLSDRYGMPKKWFLERSEYEFEKKMLYGTKDYDAILRHFYREYMNPPKNKAQHSPCVEIKFPERGN